MRTVKLIQCVLSSPHPVGVSLSLGVDVLVTVSALVNLEMHTHCLWSLKTHIYMVLKHTFIHLGNYLSGQRSASHKGCM